MTPAVDGQSESAASLAVAAQGVLEAGERMALDWLELIRLEWTDRAGSLTRGLMFTFSGLVVLLLAWGFASAALVIAIGRWLELDASLGAVAIGQTGLGAVLLRRGLRGWLTR